jgi:hypothetical protein
MGATSQRGGARPGAGRKTKRDEDDLKQLIKKCLPKKTREAIFSKWAEDAQSSSVKTRQRARETLWPYLYGKPVNRVEEPPEQEDNLAPPIGDAIERIYGGDGGTDSGG